MAIVGLSSEYSRAGEPNETSRSPAALFAGI
jgi:hypothetical protein